MIFYLREESKNETRFRDLFFNSKRRYETLNE